MAKRTSVSGENNILSLTASNIKYLITMQRLGDDSKTDGDSSKRHGVRGIEIAAELGIAKPSAHTMFENLADRGLIEKDRYGAAYLTELGTTTAERYSEYFELLFEAHRGLFKDKKEALSPICSMLAELSSESLQAMEAVRVQGVGCP